MDWEPNILVLPPGTSVQRAQVRQFWSVQRVPESESWPDIFRPPPETICILPVVWGRVRAQTRIEATHSIAPSSMLDLLSSSLLSLEGHPY